MPNYNSTARVPFKHGGSVKKPKVKRIILWKGKAKDWPGAKKAAEQTRNRKAEGGIIDFKRGGGVRGTKLKQVKAGAAKTKAGTKKGLKVLKVVGSILTPASIGFQAGKKFRDKKADGGRIEFKKGKLVGMATEAQKKADEKFRADKKLERLKDIAKSGSLTYHQKVREGWKKLSKRRVQKADGGRIEFKKGGNITVKNEKDSKKAFQIAIEKGLKNPEDHMYMYTKDGKDFFKHIGTRKYDSFKKGGKADKKWIQKATKGMRKDKPCTGKKFGSATCPPGSKRYNLAQTFKKMARSKHASGGLVRYI